MHPFAVFFNKNEISHPTSLSMSLLAFVGFVSLVSPVPSFSSEIAIATIEWQDDNLGQCIQEEASKNQWQKTSDVTSLKCHRKSIKNVDDLKHFDQLKSLSLFNNQISQADLRHMAKLTSLNLANNQLNQLRIDGLTNLNTLYLFRNKLETLDMTGLVSLQKMRMMQNQLTQLDIQPLIALETAYLFDNQLEHLDIEGLEKLTFLDVKQNPMPDELYDFFDEQDGITISHDGNADDWK